VIDRRTVLSSAALALAAGCRKSRPGLAELRLDWAYYSPLSLVLKEKGWVEEELRKDGVKVTWLLSLGSNKALELLSTGAADFGSTAGAAALLSKANGNAIKAVYVYSKPEWTALVVGRDSTATGIKDLRGQRIAATKGTDPFIFTLRILREAGLRKEDVQLVHLQHPDGRAALERGDVQAWAGLDPHMATSELEHGSKLVVRRPDFNTYGFLNVRQAFAEQHPAHVERVLAQYERARRWALGNPDELVALVARQAKLSPAVARLVVRERHDFTHPVPGAEHRLGLTRAAEVLVAESLIKPGADPVHEIDALIDDRYARTVVS
jgi:sulfonate transport system substrate-binding protein